MPIPDGFRLVRANSEDLPIVDDFGPVGRVDAERRHRDGAALWLLLDEQERPVFSCWTFVDHFPVFVAEGGSLSLREGTAAIEDSYTAAEHRGQHLGPAAFCAVVDRLVEEGLSHLITKVAEDNGSARKAALKTAFREIAIMRTSRLLWFKPRVDVSVIGAGEGPFLDRQLSNGARQPSNADPQLSNAAPELSNAA